MDIRRKLALGLWFILAVSMAFAADWLREANDSDRVVFAMPLDGRPQIVTVDLARQGGLKYYLQPGTIRLYGRGRNVADDANLYARFYGEQGSLSQTSKRGIWRELTEDSPLQVKNGGLPLYIEIAIPYARTRQYRVGMATLELRQQSRLVHSIQFQFVNSRYSLLQ